MAGRKAGKPGVKPGGKAKPKKSPAKTSRAGRHGNRTHKGQQQCRACQRWLEACKFALNQTNCQECKKALDVISKKGKARQDGLVQKDENRAFQAQGLRGFGLRVQGFRAFCFPNQCLPPLNPEPFNQGIEGIPHSRP